MRTSRVVILLLLSGLLAGCASLGGGKYPTLIPTEYLPTAIALTVEAWQTESPQTTATEAQPKATAVLPVITAEQPTATEIQPETTAVQPAVTAAPSVALSPSASATHRAGATPTLTRTAGKATQASGPTASPSASPATPEATPTPEITPTPTPTYRFYLTRTATATPGIPNATILMYNPGPMSKLTSPIQFSASLEPGASGKVVIELLGEDGRTLYRKLLRYTTREWVAISDEVEFDIAAAAETGRLQLSTEDEHGRMMGLASVELILLSMGPDDLNPPSDLLEDLIIREPVVNTLIQGGKVVVTGLVRTNGERPLLIQLVDTKGNVVGYRQAAVTLPADPWATQGYASFTVEVPYSVEGATWVRLEVSSYEDRLPGPTHLSSVVILLGP
jgi:hypothetical protein